MQVRGQLAEGTKLAESPRDRVGERNVATGEGGEALSTLLFAL